ncbi:unnamed protein product [Amoebophrya sp. A25]|nr:unnamed protein product [Amoebophrya sp. A25]
MAQKTASFFKHRNSPKWLEYASGDLYGTEAQGFHRYYKTRLEELKTFLEAEQKPRADHRRQHLDALCKAAHVHHVAGAGSLKVDAESSTDHAPASSSGTEGGEGEASADSTASEAAGDGEASANKDLKRKEEASAESTASEAADEDGEASATKNLKCRLPVVNAFEQIDPEKVASCCSAEVDEDAEENATCAAAAGLPDEDDLGEDTGDHAAQEIAESSDKPTIQRCLRWMPADVTLAVKKAGEKLETNTEETATDIDGDEHGGTADAEVEDATTIDREEHNGTAKGEGAGGEGGAAAASEEGPNGEQEQL